LFLDLVVNFALEKQKKCRLKLAAGGALVAGAKFSSATGRFPL